MCCIICHISLKKLCKWPKALFAYLLIKLELELGLNISVYSRILVPMIYIPLILWRACAAPFELTHGNLGVQGHAPRVFVLLDSRKGVFWRIFNNIKTPIYPYR